MSTFPGSPKLARGGLVLLDPSSGSVRRIIALQYNPDSLSRTLQVQGVGGDGGSDRSEALRLKGPAVETIKIEAELDAADQLEKPDQHPTAIDSGIQPHLAAIESLVNPTSAELIAGNELAGAGTIEIAPVETLLTLFVWSRHRVLPVRITECSITEEAFDPSLNPIRAKVSLGLRVLSVDDLGFSHKGGALFLGYLKNKEQLSARFAAGTAGQLGLGSIP
jgi:hypothetical protein